MSPFITLPSLGITSYAGTYRAASHEWTCSLIRNADGVMIAAVGIGDDPESAMRAAIVDFRMQVTRAMSGVAVGA